MRAWTPAAVGRACVAGGLLLGVPATPASAQVAVEAALQTDYLVRGRSVSDENPAASVSVSYDDPSGIYLGGLAIGGIRDGEARLIGIQGSAGYAMRIGPSQSLDFGISKTKYFGGPGARRGYDYSEVYVGIALPVLSARVSFSPDYYRNDWETVYAEVQSGFEPAPDWFVSGKAGVLTYLGAPPDYFPDQTFDWRVGVSRRLGLWGVHGDVAGQVMGRARKSLPNGLGLGKDRQTVVLRLTRTF